MDGIDGTGVLLYAPTHETLRRREIIMSNEKKEKEGSFDPRCVADIYDKLSNHNYALRAFGALLKSSDFNELSDDFAGELPTTHPDHLCNLRWGLSQIIDLYLAHQAPYLSAVSQDSRS
ncbi:MAG: hypothetical protein NUV76_13270 [Candidatus Kuenenia sp.]|nr:hypothetical protein [Candidatus Kuenenia sp.]